MCDPKEDNTMSSDDYSESSDANSGESSWGEE